MHLIHTHKHKTAKKVIFSFFYGIVGATMIVLLAAIIAYLMPSSMTNSYTSNIILCIGFIFDAGALYGQRGWDIQTWQGESHPERLNWLLFRIFASLGVFFTTLGCLLIN